MAGYVIAEIEITDPAAYEEYKSMVGATLEAYGGRFLARGGAAEALEGTPPGRIVVLQFESAERARKWWASEAYAPARAKRQSASRGRLIVVEGV